MEKLHGVITSMLTPFTQGGELDEETLAGELEHQLRCGVARRLRPRRHR